MHRAKRKRPNETLCDPCGKVGDLLNYLAPGIAEARSAPLWPADAFALAGCLLTFLV